MRKKAFLSNNVLQALTIIVLVMVVAVVLYAKHGQKADGALPRPVNNSANDAGRPGEQVDNLSTTGEKNERFEKPLPLLLDLGATKCKMMAPILDELREEYRGRFDVIFIDIWENKEAIDRYKFTSSPRRYFSMPRERNSIDIRGFTQRTRS